MANNSASVAKPSDDAKIGKAGFTNDAAASANQGSEFVPPVIQPAVPEKPPVAPGQAQTEQPEAYEFRDLVAQEDMAYWAMWMFFAAVATFIVTSFGTLLIWKQVRLTRQAVEDTDEATRAMKRQNDIAEDTARRQLRAYVGVEMLQWGVNSSRERYEPIDTTGEFTFKDFFIVKMKNFGQTPATDVRVGLCMLRVNFLGRPENGYDFAEHLKSDQTFSFISRTVLQTNQGYAAKIGLDDVRIFWEAQEKKYSLLVFGRIYYRDAFGTPWATNFCQVWEPWHASGPSFVPYQEFNGEDQIEPRPIPEPLTPEERAARKAGKPAPKEKSDPGSSPG